METETVNLFLVHVQAGKKKLLRPVNLDQAEQEARAILKMYAGQVYHRQWKSESGKRYEWFFTTESEWAVVYCLD